MANELRSQCLATFLRVLFMSIYHILDAAVRRTSQ